VVLLALALVTHRQIGHWSDSITLWSYALQVTSNNWIAEDNLGDMLLEQGRVGEAMPHFFRANALNPDDSTSNLNIGSYAMRRGELPRAIEQFKRVLGASQAPPVLRGMALYNLCYAYREHGDTNLAEECFATKDRLIPHMKAPASPLAPN
jgi:tetratricopeptide (TPR) repeat protein